MRDALRKYPILLITALSIVSLFVFANSQLAERLYSFFGQLGYWGAFFCGVLFAFSATAFASLVVIYHLSSYVSPIYIALLGGLGSMLTDYVLFKTLRNGAYTEMQSLWSRITRGKPPKILSSRLYRKVAPILGAMIIASPLPDELGVAILGHSHLSTPKFIIITYILNSVGIYLIALAGK
jgi:hypothetical protein